MAETGTAQGRNFVVGLGLEGDAGTPVTPTLFPAIQSETFSYDPSRQDFTGLNGTRSHHKQATADGNIVTAGGFVFNARKEYFDDILYWTLGGGNATTPTLADAVLPLTLEVDKVTRVLTYGGCKITTLEMTSESNGPLVVTPTVVPMNVSDAAAGTGTSPTRTITDVLLMHHNLTLTVDAGTIYANSFGLTIDNLVEDDHFQNSQSRTAVPEGDRTVMGTVSMDWNVANAVTRGAWTKFLSGATASITAVYTDGTNILTFVMANCHYTAGGPAQADSRGTVPWEVPFQAKSSNAGISDELTAAWTV